MIVIKNANKYITVPKNDIGIHLCEYGHEVDNENLITCAITQDRLDEVWKTGVTDRINVECNLLIDDFESERIEGENIEKCLKILNNEFVELSEALEHAKKFNTFVDLDF